jgi:hypothetical protein
MLSMRSDTRLRPIAHEFSQARLGDERRTKRLIRIAEALEKDPVASFPDAMDSVAELEALYRFVNNEAFALQEVLESPANAAFKRARQEECVIAVHDSTQFTFSTERDGFGATTHGQIANGFLAHASLLVAERDGTPMGIAYAETWTRSGAKERNRRRSKQLSMTDPTRESLRWGRGVHAVQEGLGGQVSVVHVADAESDVFEFISQMLEADAAFVIRSGRPTRPIESEGIECTIQEAADSVAERYRRKIELSPREHSKTQARIRSKRHPARAARSTSIAAGAVEVVIPRPNGSQATMPDLVVSCVHVWEPTPTKGQPPVEWTLLTNQPVTTREELARVIDIYRKRWLIEEYFKALKSGCAIERRQVGSYEGLVKVLGIFMPIAYRLLLVRHLADRQPDADATRAFSETELYIMANAPSNRGMPPPTTVELALLHLARLGGHLRNNGKPGWQTLGRGYEKLRILLEGWELATKHPHTQKCDQS